MLWAVLAALEAASPRLSRPGLVRGDGTGPGSCGAEHRHPRGSSRPNLRCSQRPHQPPNNCSRECPRLLIRTMPEYTETRCTAKTPYIVVVSHRDRRGGWTVHVCISAAHAQVKEVMTTDSDQYSGPCSALPLPLPMQFTRLAHADAFMMRLPYRTSPPPSISILVVAGSAPPSTYSFPAGACTPWKPKPTGTGHSARPSSISVVASRHKR